MLLRQVTTITNIETTLIDKKAYQSYSSDSL